MDGIAQFSTEHTTHDGWAPGFQGGAPTAGRTEGGDDTRGPGHPVTVDASDTFEALLRMQAALVAAREAHDQVVSLAVDLIALTRGGGRGREIQRATAAFDAAVMALGLAALEHLPLCWAKASAADVSAALYALGTAAVQAAPPAEEELAFEPNQTLDLQEAAVVFEHEDQISAQGARPHLPTPEARPASPAALATRWLAAATGRPVAPIAPSAVAEVSTVEAAGQPAGVGQLFDFQQTFGERVEVQAHRAPGPVDLRSRYVDPDDESIVDWPTEDPGPVGERPKAAVTPAVLQALQSSMSAGPKAAAPPVLEAKSTSSKASPMDTLRALPPVPARIDDAVDFAEEYRRLQSCSDPTRLAKIEGLSAVAQSQVAEYLAARIHRLQSEVPVDRRPNFVAGENAYRTLLRGLAQFVVGLRRQMSKIEPLRPAPRQRDWLREAEVLEASVRTALAATGGTRISTPPVAAQAPTFNLERALENLARAIDEDEATLPLVARVRHLLTEGAPPDHPRLCALLVERVAELTSPVFKTLRGKIRKFAKAQQEVDESPEPWAIAPTLAGKRVLLVGGDRTAGVLDRLRTHLPGASLDWVETSPNSGVRQVQAARDRIANGSVDMVLLITSFISHKVSDVLTDARKGASGNVYFQAIKRGYGLTQLRLALESAVRATQA